MSPSCTLFTSFPFLSGVLPTVGEFRLWWPLLLFTVGEFLLEPRCPSPVDGRAPPRGPAASSR